MNEQLNIFYNTTSLKGENLVKREKRIGGQNLKVLNFFQLHPYENYIPHDVFKALGVNNQPKSSIQRSITDLTSMGYLIKLDGKEGRQFVQRTGEWGEPCFCWMLK